MKYFVQKVHDVFKCITSSIYHTLKIVPEKWQSEYHGRLSFNTWGVMYSFPDLILYDENHISFINNRLRDAECMVLTLDNHYIKEINSMILADGDLYSLDFVVDIDNLAVHIEINLGRENFQDFCDEFKNFPPVKEMLLKLIM